jgi:hypothetical protein
VKEIFAPELPMQRALAVRPKFAWERAAQLALAEELELRVVAERVELPGLVEPAAPLEELAASRRKAPLAMVRLVPRILVERLVLAAAAESVERVELLRTNLLEVLAARSPSRSLRPAHLAESLERARRLESVE